MIDSKIQDLLLNKKIILVCGSGGVGKTTLSASLGILASSLGKKVAVITIDPAKRLANSLGLESLKDKPQKISLSVLKKQKKSGEFYAMMLDTKSAFDELVARYAPDKESREKIYQNKIYQHLSQVIVGSQEYMAMEKLYELSESGQFDLIIIDTPPAVHAMDFLQAPDKMVQAIENSIVKVFIQSAKAMSSKGLKIFSKSSAIIMKIFDKIIGSDFMQEVSQMLLAFHSMLDGFQSRASLVKDLLQKKETSFVMVGVCQENSLNEFEIFSSNLEKEKMNLDLLILNRLLGESSKNKVAIKSLLEKEYGLKLAKKMVHQEKLMKTQRKLEKQFLEEFKKKLKKDQILLGLPYQGKDIHDVSGLWELGQLFTHLQ